MKLATYSAIDGSIRAAILEGDSLYDAATVLGEPALRDLRAVLELPYDALGRLRQRGLDGAGDGTALLGATLQAPVLQPPQVRDHFTFEAHASGGGAVELPSVWYQRPVFYFASTASMLGSGATIRPPQTDRLDYELEIAAIIGREVSDVGPDDAWDAIAGFTIFNDWSARDIQQEEMVVGLGPSKGKDFASSLGPWMVTVDELEPFITGDRLDLQCRVLVNGETWGESRTGAMHHGWSTIVSHASASSRLLPGDVLASGTVTGCCVYDALRSDVGARYLLPGDRVELEVEGLGTLVNRIGPRKA